MSDQSIPPAEAFFRRHQDNPKLYRIIYGIAWFCLAYGFVLFNVGGYHRATVNGGYYAEMGLFVLGVLFMFSGAMLLTIRHRKNDSDFRSPAHAIMFHIKIVAIPLAVALLFSWIPVIFLWTPDSHMELTVKATEAVKRDLKFLLGDLYPADMEDGIDPETLEWTMALKGTPDSNYKRFIKSNSPKVTPTQKAFYSDQLNTQKFEATWLHDGKKTRQDLEIDWKKAEFFGYQNSKKKHSYPICDLKAPLIQTLPANQDNVTVLFNNKKPEDQLIDFSISGFNPPTNLPEIMRIENNHLIVRTNYFSTTWPIYCLYNFPEHNRDYSPEQITSTTLNSLNSGLYKLHFALFPGIHASNAIMDYKVYDHIRLATYQEYFENLNDFVGMRILNTNISTMGSIERY